MLLQLKLFESIWQVENSVSWVFEKLESIENTDIRE